MKSISVDELAILLPGVPVIDVRAAAFLAGQGCGAVSGGGN